MNPLDPPDVIEIQAAARRRCRRSLKGLGIKPACVSIECTGCASIERAIADLIEATTPEAIRKPKRPPPPTLNKHDGLDNPTLSQNLKPLVPMQLQIGGDRRGRRGFTSLGNGGFWRGRRRGEG